MKQLTKNQAITLFESGAWKRWSNDKLVWFQLNQNCLCVDWGHFRGAIESVLGREVYSHEFGVNRQGLIDEFKGIVAPPSLDDIISMIPMEKIIIAP
jgi:hypothetical protein